ncbi:NADH-quinone oxidoreductase subunit NuoE family protein [Shewanella surugensis]|uniref:NADH-quinone oxidoreductase subunit E n=1 Tax=Shewanella surugensis TaxID=212020 RepID=A0ABT0L8V8_9GAMM|nr:NAD(P)H-dependent oxidoreductase subunit E [Shewanella surugensis]MCL1124093.1 NAD(P)H-dependent oxidoreductase subunit E [Shewanella surugensis]
MFTPDELTHLKQHVNHYPEPRAGAIYCLYAVQDKVGHINDKGIEIVTELTGLSKTQQEELISFYTLLRRRPIGRNVLRICDSISCHVMGSKAILDAAIKQTGVPIGEISKDGSVTVLPSICLGLCNKAPAALLNEMDEVENLNVHSINEYLNKLSEKPHDLNNKGSGSNIIATSGRENNS